MWGEDYPILVWEVLIWYFANKHHRRNLYPPDFSYYATLSIGQALLLSSAVYNSSLLSFPHVSAVIIQEDLLDPAGPLSSELISAVIVETNAAINNLQSQDKTKKQGTHMKLNKVEVCVGKYWSENGRCETLSRESVHGHNSYRHAYSTHYFLCVLAWRKFYLMQTMSLWRNFSPTKYFRYTVLCI